MFSKKSDFLSVNVIVAELRESGGRRRDCLQAAPDDFPSGDGNRTVPPPRETTPY